MFQDGAANGFGTKTCYTCKKVWHTEGNYDGPSKKCLAQQYSDWELEWILKQLIADRDDAPRAEY
ncbi:hypothetical protein PLICBS_007099 [Purpureocillium lilacinum]|nr:hypothetical protein PLICBS_007099 [Purpureocillium lilacinum]